MLTENMDKLAVSMNDLRQRLGDGKDSSRNSNRSWARGRDQYRSDSGQGTETGVTQETGHGPEEETEGIEIMIDNIEVETGAEIIIEILETIGIETTGTLDQTEVIDQEAIIEKDIMVTIIEGLTIVLDVTVIKVAIIIRDLRIEVILMAEETQRGNTPYPHYSIQSMQDSINLIVDESCNLLDLQDTYKDSLNL